MLRVWLPLNGNLDNIGLSDLKFNVVDSSYTKVYDEGKIGKCYGNSNVEHGGIISDKKINLGLNQSMFCFVKFNPLTIQSGHGIFGQHRHVAYSGMGLNITPVLTNEGSIINSQGHITINTGNGTDRTYDTYRSNAKLYSGIWYHVGFTYNGTILKLYINGNVDKEFTITDQLVVEDYLQVFGWAFHTTIHDINPYYKFDGYINDVRIYDHCLSAKEAKEISKGLVLHYPMNDRYIESTKNMLKYPEFNGYVPENRGAWDSSLHKNAIDVKIWNAGYNSGVPDPEIGYHAMWNLIDGIPTVVFQNLNSQFGHKNRWLGVCNYDGINWSLQKGLTYTISFEAKTDTPGCVVNGGLYYRAVGDTFNAFWDGRIYATLDSNWKRYSQTFEIKNEVDQTISAGFYCYGWETDEGIMYVRNFQLEFNVHATPYTKDNRISDSIVHDCSGYGNDGLVITEWDYDNNTYTVGDIEVVDNSPRYNNSYRFPGDRYIAAGKGAKVTDEITVSVWAYMNDWSLFSSSCKEGMRLITCTEGGGWNFRVDTDNNNYISFNIYRNGGYIHAISLTTKFSDLVSGWHQFVGTYNGYKSKLYIDGELHGSSEETIEKYPICYNATNGIFIGMESGSLEKVAVYMNSYDTPFIGNISDVRIYATALSEEDIKSLYNSPISIDKNGNVYAYEYIE